MNWKKDNIEFKIIKEHGFYFGFCTFPYKMDITDDFLRWVPVYGGLCSHFDGFDTFTAGFMAHSSSNPYNPLCSDINWIKSECERMAIAVDVARMFYKDFETSDDKTSVIKRYHKKLKEIGIEYKDYKREEFVYRMIEKNLLIPCLFIY